MRRIALLLLGPLVLLLVAYLLLRQATPAPTHTFGPITQTGTVVPTSVSLIRRGTHLLSVEGVEKYYLESRDASLPQFEDQLVVVEGTLEANRDTDALPVIVVSAIRPVAGGSLHEWKIPAFGVSIWAPDRWIATIDDTLVHFHIATETEPVLTVELQKNAAMPKGDAVYVGGKSGVKVALEDGTQDVYVKDGKNVLHLHLSPATEDMVRTPKELQLIAQEFNAVLLAIRFNSSQASTASQSASQDTDTNGQPCGGTAGILCPAGYYCAVFDTQLNIGKCKQR